MVVSPLASAHKKLLPRKTINYYPLMGSSFFFACSQLFFGGCMSSKNPMNKQKGN
jgi:hypothetical protein